MTEKRAWKLIEGDPRQALSFWAAVKAKNGAEIDRNEIYGLNKEKRWTAMAVAKVGLVNRREVGNEQPTFNSIANGPGKVFYSLNSNPPPGVLERLFELANYKPKDS